MNKEWQNKLKKNIKSLENYLTEKQKVYVFLLVLTFFFGTLNSLNSKSLLPGLFALTGLLLTIAIFFAKIGFISDSNGFYQGLMVGTFVFHKEKINVQDFDKVLVFENTSKQSIPIWTGLTLDMFINDSAFVLYMINELEKKKNHLISFREKEPMEDAVRFLRNNTNLKIEFATRE